MENEKTYMCICPKCKMMYEPFYENDEPWTCKACKVKMDKVEIVEVCAYGNQGG